MHTVAEVIQRVQSLYSKGAQSRSTRLSNRHIYHKLCTVRSRLIYQKLNKKQSPTQWAYQILPCVELIQVPKHECPCVPENNCLVLRSKYKIPKPINSLSTDSINSVTSIDGSISFDRGNFETQKYDKGNKYTSSKPKYYFSNEYLYITHNKVLEAVRVPGIFDDPVAAANFPSYCEEDICPECNCKSALDSNFYIDSELLDVVVELTAEELLAKFLQSREDLTNDARDNTIQESKS